MIVENGLVTYDFEEGPIEGRHATLLIIDDIEPQIDTALAEPGVKTGLEAFPKAPAKKLSPTDKLHSKEMSWCRELASESCRCLNGRTDKDEMCPCVADEIFERCYRHFETDVRGIQSSKRIMKVSEYRADFVRIVERTLGKDTLNHRVFRYHYYLGADEALIARRLLRSAFRVTTCLAELRYRCALAFLRTQPYGIFPVGGY